MKKPGAFAGGFFLHPVFVVAVIVLPINNLWFKSTGYCQLLAGKISDAAIMIFLPALICLGAVFLRYSAHTIEILISRDQDRHRGVSYLPSHRLIVTAVVISGGLMILLQISDTAAGIYDATLRLLNDILFAGRVTAEPVKDLTDLATLPFLVVPYLILNKARRNPKRARGLQPGAP